MRAEIVRFTRRYGRYACRPAGRIDAKLQLIHVKEPGADAPAIAAGWALRSWRQELLSQAGEEIIQLLHEDLSRCKPVGDPILVVGLPAPPSAAAMHQLLRSEMLRHLHCPLLVGLTMASLDKALLCPDGTVVNQGRLERFAGLFKNTSLGVDLLCFGFTVPGEEHQDAVAMQENLNGAVRHLESLGMAVGRREVVRGRPAELAALTGDYGLMAPPLGRLTPKDSPWVAMLGHCTTSLLLC